MASVNKQNNYEQVYNVSEDAAVLSQASQSLCIIMPRGAWVAAFNAKGELLSIHYTGYSKKKPVWQTEFYEQLFASEPLLAKKAQVKGVFLCTEKTMVVPNELYTASDAATWLARLYLVEPSETVQSYPLDALDAQYVLAVPVNITELIRINFTSARTLPLAAYQLRNGGNGEPRAFCCITPEQACITLFNNKILQWHHVADFSVNDSLAFSIRHFCREQGIDDAGLAIDCSILAATEFDAVNGLANHYPGVWGSKGEKPRSRWAPAISLANQLLSCV